MGRSSLRRVLAPFALATLVLAACGDDDDSDDDGDTNVELANPASVFCVEQGGTSEIRDTADGQVGICILPDGTEVDEWEYYNEQTGGTIPESEDD